MKQRDNPTKTATNGRESPVGHERWRRPGCHQRSTAPRLSTWNARHAERGMG